MINRCSKFYFGNVKIDEIIMNLIFKSEMRVNNNNNNNKAFSKRNK